MLNEIKITVQKMFNLNFILAEQTQVWLELFILCKFSFNFLCRMQTNS